MTLSNILLLKLQRFKNKLILKNNTIHVFIVHFKGFQIYRSKYKILNDTLKPTTTRIRYFFLVNNSNTSLRRMPI